MIGIGIANSLGLSAAAAGPDPAASAYFAATGITGSTQQQAIDTLVKSLKANNIWSKMKAVYPFVTDNRNLLGYTEDFSNAYWYKAQCTVTANSTTAPNGTLTADTVTPNTTNNYHLVEQLSGNITTTSNNISISCYFKPNGYNYASLLVRNNNSYSKYFEGVFNISSGTVENTSRSLIYTGTRSIESVGNGWYRCSITITNADINSTHGLLMSTLSTNNSSATWSGNGTSGMYYWGVQFEMGSTATTYQPIATTQQAFISSQFKYNLKDPRDLDAAFRLVFNGGWTHSSNGATPNGTNGYADTYLIPSSVLTLNSTHLSFYSRTSGIVNGQRDIGVFVNGNDPCMSLGTNTGVQISDSYHPTTNRISASIANALGFVNGSRVSSTSHKLYKSGAQIGATDTFANVTSLPNQKVYLGAVNITPSNPFVAAYSTKQVAFSTIGDGLTDAEASNLYTLVQAFQTTLNRQV